VVAVVPESEMVEALVSEGRRLVEEGVEARLAAADLSAAKEAEADRLRLLDIQPEANSAAERRQRVEIIARGAKT